MLQVYLQYFNFVAIFKEMTTTIATANLDFPCFHPEFCQNCHLFQERHESKGIRRFSQLFSSKQKVG